MKADTKKPKLNVRLLRKIQRYIMEEPRRFMMRGIIARGTPGKTDWDFHWSDIAHRVPPCGTAACIAGWTNLLTGASQGDESDLTRARERLGITSPIARYAPDPLFDLQAWPEPFRSRYSKAANPKRRAQIAAERIDHFIKTKGAE